MSILFTNVTAVTMNDAAPLLKNGFVSVEGTNITYVGTQRPEGTFEQVIDGTGKVLMPGFVNAHTHVPMTPMRGYGGGHDLQSWLNDFIFPAEEEVRRIQQIQRTVFIRFKQTAQESAADKPLRSEGNVPPAHHGNLRCPAAFWLHSCCSDR